MNMARRLEIEWHEDATSLLERYKKEKDKQKSKRLHGLCLLRQAYKLEEVAEIMGVHYRTLQKWVSWYRQGGVEAVLSHRHGEKGGPQRQLSPSQEAELKAKADAGEISSIADGVKWVQEKHQVTYSYWGMRHVFHRLKLKRKVPRPRNPKASETEQEAWKKGG
jgi:transposase